MKDLQAYIGELVGLGGYAPDVIANDEEWITLTRSRLLALLKQVRDEAQADDNAQLSYEELTKRIEANNLAR